MLRINRLCTKKKITARKTERVVDLDDDIPFHPLTKPLSECTFSLITTGGTHLSTQTPFDMLNADGDASFREIPSFRAA